MNKLTVSIIAALIAVSVLPSESLAQGKGKDEQKGIPLDDGITLMPYFNLGLTRDNNLFLQERNQRSSSIALYNPGLRLEAVSQLTKITLGADSKIARYKQSEADNYQDYLLNALLEYTPTSSLSVQASTDLLKGHDPRGSTDRGIVGQADEYKTKSTKTLIGYGGKDAKGRFEFEAGRATKDYLNNRSTTTAADRTNDSFAGRMFLKIAPKTSGVFEARRERIDYKLNTSTQDGRETRLLAGLKWEATALTSGTFKVGRIQKDFDSSLRADYSSSGWEGTIEWKPLGHSKVDFKTEKTFAESTGVGNFTLSKKHSAAWSHLWGANLVSQLVLARNSDQFVGDVRRDETNSFGLKLNYKVSRWLNVGGEASRTTRDSNQAGSDYTKNVYGINVSAAL